MRRRTSTVLLSVALCATALAACSSGSKGAAGATAPSSRSSSGTQAVDASALVSLASHSSSALKSAHITSTTSIGGKTSTISGAVAYHPTRLDLTIDTGAAKLREILVGNTFYIKLPAAAGAPKPWVSVSVKKISALTGIDLDNLLNSASADQTVQLLTKASTVKYVGTEQVNGVSARHLSGTVDVDKVFAALTATQKSQQTQLKNLVDSVGMKNNTIDLWVNDRNIPIKVEQSYDSNLGHGTSTMFLTDLDGPVTVKVPPASQAGKFPG
jgi:hypothetical protein